MGRGGGRDLEIVPFRGPEPVRDGEGKRVTVTSDRVVRGMGGQTRGLMVPRGVLRAYWRFQVLKGLTRGAMFSYGGEYFFDLYPGPGRTACAWFVWDGSAWVSRPEPDR